MADKNLFDLTGKTAVITGANRGLGQYFGRALAKAGADLIITARKAEDLGEFKREIEALGRTVTPLPLDVRDCDSIQRFGKAANEAVERIDILINNAGCNVRKHAFEITWDDWNLVLDTNLRGMFFVSQVIAPNMIRHGWGRIINVGSVTSVFGWKGMAPYVASRGAVR